MRDIETRKDIEELMTEFYRKALNDDRIGYIFTDVAGIDMEHHLPIITDFWEMMLFGTINFPAKYGRSPMQVHHALNEKENSTNFNPAAAPHSELSSDNDTNDIYRSEIQGLIAIENDLAFQNAPLVRGQVIVGHDIANSSGALEVEFQPDSLLNPPPGFLAPTTYSRRPSSATKAVLP